jgi:alkanesulfonate monooxygenase SsuD/methylene tetrahydromethanopterin reductase-like flavin-dependent oxidoreductase (luciferase family)
VQIGIGLPAHIPGVSGKLVLDWARKADAGPFSSLGIIDRIVYPNIEPLIAFAAAAGVTQRARLVTTVLVAPLRNAVMLAKQAASLDVLCAGRLTLGLGIGGREDEFQATSSSLHDRGKRFEQQLDTMKRIWAGEAVSATVGPVGPQPVQQGGPEILIGGYSPAAMKRVGRWSNGLILGSGAPPAQAVQLYNAAQESWKAHNRPGKPRFVGCIYHGIIKADRLIVFGGGFPIKTDQGIIGGLGVSGGHWTDDMEVAQAALAAL